MMKSTVRNHFIFYVIVSYLIFGTAWIFLSDKMLLAFTSVDDMSRLSTVKGMVFIIITDLLLFFALSGIPDRKTDESHGSPLDSGQLTFSDRYPRWIVYTFAVAVSGAMLLLRMQIAVAFGERPMLILFMMPIILSSALGGLGPGLAATAISAFGVNYFGIIPTHNLRIREAHDLFQWFMLIVSGIMASYLCELLHRARRLADERRILQERAREELRLSEERFNLAMQGANDGLWDWNMTTDEVYLSPRWVSMLGYEEDELEHHLDTWKQVVHPNDMQRTLDRVNDILDGRADRFDVEFRLRHKDGHYLDIMSRAFPVRNEKGRIIRLVGTHVDVTERRKAERKLREREALLYKTSRMARVGGWGFDVATGKGDWTDEVARIHDFDPDQETNVDIGLNFYHGEHLEAIQNAVKEAIEEARPYDLELELVSAKGIHKWVRTVGNPVIKEGDVVRVEGIIHDISALKKAELELQALNVELEQRVEQRTAELVAANDELESFAYAVSHDLRAPLRAMSGFSYALIEDFGDKLEDAAKVYLDQIIIGSRRMGELIDGLLTLSRSTRSQLQRYTVDLSAIAERVLGELLAVEPDRIVRWTVELGLTAQGDPAMLDVLMTNLISNAWKYSSRRDETLIRVFSSQEDEKYFICISDNGAGFEESHASKLFQPFQRLHRQEEFPGIGIGLATAQRIVNRHGGEIRAQGRKDQGAVFCFRLPVYSEKESMHHEV
ncbi:MAG: PAS domain-containing protein [Desulfobacteraceae bacterium]|jgi:PAS domain S-box-containing protein